MRQKALPTEKYKKLIAAYDDQVHLNDQLRTVMLEALHNPIKWREILKDGLIAATGYIQDMNVTDISADLRLNKNKTEYNRNRQRLRRGSWPEQEPASLPAMTDEEIEAAMAPLSPEEQIAYDEWRKTQT